MLSNEVEKKNARSFFSDVDINYAQRHMHSCLFIFWDKNKTNDAVQIIA